MIARSAALLMAEGLNATLLSTNSVRVNATNAWHGTAAAIDRRGYFLTAAHCVEKGHFWLAFLQGGKLEVNEARIVWRGEIKEKQPDLALLSVSIPIEQAFEWATDFTNGAPVMDVGFNLDRKSHVLKIQCMAGQILKITDEPTSIPSDYTVVYHDSPLRRGDSGGPLVMSDGRLLGINVRETLDFRWNHFSFRPAHGEAHQPNLAWLRNIIEADAASQSKSMIGLYAAPN